MKKLEAFVAAVIVTGLVGLGMLTIGVNALLNPNAVAAANAPSDPTLGANTAPPDTQGQIKQLQDLVAQYQNREKQYQEQLSQANTQLEQYQQLLVEMQRRGLIRINGDGSIQLPRRNFGDNGG